MAETIKDADYFDQLFVCFVSNSTRLWSSRGLHRNRLRAGLMTGTRVTRAVGTQEITLDCPFVFFSYRDQVYSWLTPSGVFRNSFYFDLAGSRAEELERTLKTDFPDGVVPVSDPVPFQQLLEQIHDSYFIQNPLRHYKLPLLAEEFIARVYMEQTAVQSPNKYARIILQDADEIGQAPGENHNFEQKAQKLGITFIHYRRIFKTVIGVPPYQYLQQCRLRLAIRLLKSEKQLQIQQIASECGFGNASEFSRFFRRQTGFSPLNYSKNFFE